MSLLRFLEILGITILIAGSIVVAIISVVWKLPVETILAMILGLLGALGLYELAANLKVEEKIGNLQPKQIPLSQQVTQAEWYDKLHEVIISAKQEILITHHDPRIPTLTGLQARRQLLSVYFSHPARRAVPWTHMVIPLSQLLKLVFTFTFINIYN